MKEFTVHNNCILCRKISDKTSEIESKGIVYTTNTVPVYEVIDVGTEKESMGFELNVGDRILSTSSSKVLFNGEYVYIIDRTNIVAKVID